MDILFKLMNEYGISGDEGRVRKIIENEIKKYVDTTRVDKTGNLIAVKKGTTPRIMLAAHMDEIGLIIKSIEPEGRIYFTTLGGLDPMSLIGQRVNIGNVTGIITTDVLIDGNIVEQLPHLETMFIDTGLNKIELSVHGVEIGSYISLIQESGMLGMSDIIFGKALDDRVGCYILLELAKLCKNVKNEINYVFTVQEEIGLYGARTASYSIEADWAIAVDVSNTYEKKGLRILGNGPTLLIRDSEMIGNRSINSWLLDISKHKKIPIQKDVSDGGTTDALSISLSHGGTPTTTIGIPVKNIHTTFGIASKRDIENCIKLIHELLKDPPKKCVV